MRFGLVGAGPWATSTHAPALLSHPEVDLVGVWARRPSAAASLGAPVFDDYDALLEAVDAVAFAVPPAVQAPLAVRAATAGKHLVLDKPLAGDLAAAEDLVRVVEQAGVATIMVLTRRFATETRAFLDAARGGDWAAAEAVWLSGAVLGGVYAGSSWRHELGALADIGPHVLDLVDAALGPITGVRHAHHHAPSDTWQIGLEHTGDRRSVVTLSLRTPVTPSVLRVSVHGAGGVVELSGRESSSLDCYAVLLDELLSAARAHAPHPLDVHRGLHLQQVAEQVRRAL